MRGVIARWSVSMINRSFLGHYSTMWWAIYDHG